jgi:phosphonoacetaldehyde hydrolase
VSPFASVDTSEPGRPLTVRAVIFDWAGTTQDHGVFAPIEAVLELFRREAVPITIEEARAPMGRFKLDHIREITRMPDVAARWRIEKDADPDEADVQRMYTAFEPIQVAVIARHANLIDGVVPVMDALRSRGIAIGSTTGYMRAAAAICLSEAARDGYVPDACVTSDEVPAGRPAPWMLFRNLELLGRFPPTGAVKVGDTPVDIEEGLNAGAWSVGVAASSNEVGLTATELAALPERERRQRVARAAHTLRRAGAHYVIDTVADLLPVVDEIDQRLAAGDRP